MAKVNVQLSSAQAEKLVQVLQAQEKQTKTIEAITAKVSEALGAVATAAE